MCLENTWYVAIFLTLGTWWCIATGIVVATLLIHRLIGWWLYKAQAMVLFLDFVRNRQQFKKWVREQGFDDA